MRDHLEVVEREHVGRVGDRDAQHAVLLLDRDGAVAAGDLLGDALGDDLVDRRRVEVHERHAEALGEDLRRVDRGDELELDQDLAEPAAGAALHVERLRELLVGDHPVLDEQVADTTADGRGPGVGVDDVVHHTPSIDARRPGLRGSGALGDRDVAGASSRRRAARSVRTRAVGADAARSGTSRGRGQVRRRPADTPGKEARRCCQVRPGCWASSSWSATCSRATTSPSPWPSPAGPATRCPRSCAPRGSSRRRTSPRRSRRRSGVRFVDFTETPLQPRRRAHGARGRRPRVPGDRRRLRRHAPRRRVPGPG